MTHTVPRRLLAIAGVAFVGILAIGYVGVLGYFGIAAMLGGTPFAVAIGLGCLFLAVLGGWAVVREILFGLSATRLTDRLAAEEGLPTDLLPVGVSGRPDKEIAIASMGAYREAAARHDAGWRELLRYAVMADAAGDRRAARRATIAALRTARRSDR